MSAKRTPSSGFVHLHVRSAHSHLFGASRLEELLQTARALGYHDLALTDRNGLYGAVAFYRQAREAGLRPILGVELAPGARRGPGGRAPLRVAANRGAPAWAPEEGAARAAASRGGSGDPPRAEAAGASASAAPPGASAAPPDAAAAPPGPRPGRAVCLARSLAGYRTLCRLTTALHLKPGFDLAEALAHDHEDIYVLVPEAGLLARLAGRVPQGRLFALVEEFGDRSMRLRNDGLARAARRRGVPLAAGGAVAFHAPGRYAAHRTLRAIATLSTVADVPRRELAHPKAYLKGPEAMAALFRAAPEAVANTVRLAADCRVDLPLGRPVFPRAPLPDGETAYSRLAGLALAGLKERYRPLRPEAVRRLETELAVIDRLGFADYFLILHEIASWARGRGIPCVARGSAAGSLAAYCLGLSGVDPLAYGLLFERFLNLERADCPDIDLDICWRSRDEVIGHVYDTYGPARVAMVSTHQTFQARSALREVARAHGLPPQEADRLCGRLPYYSATGIRDAVLSFPELRDFPLDRPDVARMLELAAMLDGLPRHLSVHVGGLVVADRPLTDYLPLQPAAKGVVIAQYEADAVESLGLVKMDLLAQRSLSILATAAREIQKNHGLRIEPERIADGDAATAARLARGDTFGCFQIESPGMRNLLKMMGARRRMDVILGLSLIRPGPASSGMKDRFVRRRRGLEPPEVLHPALRDVLADTCGVMLYQEDVIRVAHAAAGFTLAEGDRLRKDLAKGVAAERLAGWREKFVRGALARGARRPDAETLWDRVAQFAAYAYCKAHACTYGEIAYRAAYLRAHWPAEFAAAVLANQAGYYERRTYVEDARRHGCPILGPDVNASGVEPSTEWVAAGGAAAATGGRTTAGGPAGRAPLRVAAKRGAPAAPADGRARRDGAAKLADGLARRDGAACRGTACRAPTRPPADAGRRVGLRIGLMDVRGLSERAMRDLVRRREEDGPYRSVADVLSRVRLSREEAENLALAGAFDALAGNRPQALWQVHALAAGPPTPGPLLPGTDAPGGPASGPALPDYSLARKLEVEAHVLGLTPSAHPMKAYEPIADCRLKIADWQVETAGLAATGAPGLAGGAGRGPGAASPARWPRAVAAPAPRGPRGTSLVRTVDLVRLVGQEASVAGVLFAERRARTRDGQFMKFLSLEDAWGVVEAVLLPDAYQRLGGRVTTRGPYLVTGTVEDHFGALSLLVTDLRPVAAPDAAEAGAVAGA